MTRADRFENGTWNAVCFECGRKFKASELRKHWQGYYVCTEHWEPRHPQDFTRGVADNMGVPWAQPMEDRSIDVNLKHKLREQQERMMKENGLKVEWLEDHRPGFNGYHFDSEWKD